MSRFKRILAALCLMLFGASVGATVPPSLDQWSITTTTSVCQPYVSTYVGASPVLACSQWCWSAGFSVVNETADSASCKSGFSGTEYAVQHTYTCPEGTTKILQAGAYVCLSPGEELCRSTASVGGDAYFDMGTSPASVGVQRLACQAGCYATWTGASPTRSALVAGVRHYYGTGHYQLNGDGVACTVGSEGAVAGSTGMNSTPSSCASGSSPMTIDGVVKCVVIATNAVAAETVSVPTATVTNATVTNPDNSHTVTTTTTNNQTNNTTTSTATYAPGVAVPALPSQQTIPLAAGAGGGISSDSDMGTFCSANPTVDACQVTSSGTGAAISDLYTPDATGRTFAGSLSTFKNSALGSGVVSAASSFLRASAVSGTCTGLSASYSLLGHAFVVDAGPVLCGETAQTAFSYLAIGLLMAATALAFWIAIL